jgi:hypothetical protein
MTEPSDFGVPLTSPPVARKRREFPDREASPDECPGCDEILSQ